MGTPLFRSGDGGRTWELANQESHPQTSLHRLGDGRWIGFTPPRSLQRWDGGKFRPLLTLPAEPLDMTADTLGALLIRNKDGSLWALERDQSELRRLKP